MGLSEPLEHGLSLTGAGVYERHRARRHVALATVRVQPRTPPDHLVSLALAAGITDCIVYQDETLAIEAKDKAEFRSRL